METPVAINFLPGRNLRSLPNIRIRFHLMQSIIKSFDMFPLPGCYEKSIFYNSSDTLELAKRCCYWHYPGYY